jgi:hypothetical protein
MKNSKKFIILMPWGRVGSNAICSALSEIDIKIYNETMTEIATQNDFWNNTELRKGVDGKHQDWISNDYTNNTTDPVIVRNATKRKQTEKAQKQWWKNNIVNKNGNIGVNIAFNSMANRIFFQKQLNKNQYPLIIMDRENIVKTIVSQMIAESLQKYAEHEKVRNTKYNLDINNFLHKLHMLDILRKEMREFVSSVNVNKEYIEYEEIKRDFFAVFDKIIYFLDMQDVDYEKAKAQFNKHKKMTNNNLRNVIKNFNEIHESIKGTKFEAMLLEK